MKWYRVAFTVVTLTAITAASQPNSQVQNASPDPRDEAVALLAQPADERDLIRLVQLDYILADEGDARSADLCRKIMHTLAVSEDPTALEHVRSVFENEPERRAVAAWALSQSTSLRPSDLQDWRYMVRSLTVVEGADAVDVMKALLRFRPRANKPLWVRRVILIGLRLPSDQQGVACTLLKHWTGFPRGRAEWTLADYQMWFSKEHPESPAAVLPADPPGRRWSFDTVMPILKDLDSAPDSLAAGQLAWQKAGCQKCHKRRGEGDAFGPDLTSLGWRRRRQEILEAILYPSHELDEEYPTVTVELKSGKTVSGVMSAVSADSFRMISSTAEHTEFARSDIESIRNQPVSNMPDGLLEPLTAEEIRALFVFLTSIDGIPRPHSDEAP